MDYLNLGALSKRLGMIGLTKHRIQGTPKSVLVVHSTLTFIIFAPYQPIFPTKKESTPSPTPSYKLLLSLTHVHMTHLRAETGILRLRPPHHEEQVAQ